MTISYLLIKETDDFITTGEQFKSFLSSNSRLKINDSSITFRKTKFNYSIICNEIEWKKKKETIISFSVSIEDESMVEILEDLDGLIHRLKSPSGERIIINTVWDDISTYYAQKLYPSTLNIENLLRNIIYKFMIKIAGSSWFESSIPGATKKAIKDTANKNKDNEFVSDQLYYADFIHLSSFLFDPYSSRAIDSNLIRELKEQTDEGTISKDSIALLIDIYEPKSNWNRYFADKIHVDNLEEKWRKLYQYRNAVAHAKRLRGKDYKEAITIIEELKKAFEDCLIQIDSVKVTEEESEVVQKVARTTVPLEKDYLNAIQRVMGLGYQSAAESALNQIKPIVNSLDYFRTAKMFNDEYISPMISAVESLGPAYYDLLSNVVHVPIPRYSSVLGDINSAISKELSLSSEKSEKKEIKPDDNNSGGGDKK